MVIALLSPATIREVGLAVLAKNKTGLRQSDLFRLTEESFEVSLTPNAVKNALWNIDELYPEYVFKQKISTKFVVLMPTPKLIEEKQYIFEENDDNKFRINERESTYASTNLNLGMLSAKTNELLRYVELMEIEPIVNSIDSGYTMQEVEAIFNIKTALEHLRKARNILVHASRHRKD